VLAEESAMTDRNTNADDIEDAHDPDKGSTWNTFDHTANIEELLAEQEIEDLMEEIPQGELSVISDTDIPREPG
jgi:hypothetical protein